MKTRAPRFRTPLGAAVLALSTFAAIAGCDSEAAPAGSASKSPTSRQSPQSPPVSAQPAPSQGDVTAKLRRLEETRDVRIGAYAVDTATGRFVAHRADETFPFASTFKAFACGAVLRKARDSDPGLMDRVIRYKKSDLAAFSPVTEKHVGTGMTVADLCHATITRSDNTAGNLVLKEIGGPAGLTAFLRSLGDTVTRSDRWEPGLNDWKPGEKRDTTAPRAWAGSLRALTVGDALAPADRDRLNAWLKATVTGGKRIRAGLPEGWAAGDKTGTGGTYGSANDIAIVWPPSRAPLVIAILTTRPDAGARTDERAIAETARVLTQALR
ncbi:class A beta-lactamase [Actinomadura sp. KC216]|uniref:class A beta-lactamase n=1 Tax=Actinomadura sp. KC216 TaxID=2530370 RepID=UPI0010441100|nr:class A beta-lactamase [Actinomadura sp. KC216]TDB89461.1 class A beta-lactamase [Actinomadura sp. KC216]